MDGSLFSRFHSIWEAEVEDSIQSLESSPSNNFKRHSIWEAEVEDSIQSLESSPSNNFKRNL